MNKLLNNLFDDNIEEGVVFRLQRCSGKTTFVKYKAKELLKTGNRVVVIVHNTSMKEMYKDLQHKNFSIISYYEFLNIEISKTAFVFYDEPWLSGITIVQQPRRCFIGTDNTNTYTVLTKLNVDESMNEMIGEKRFREEFECNVYKRKSETL